MQSNKVIFLASAAVSFLLVTAASAQEHPNRLEHREQPRLHSTEHHAGGGVYNRAREHEGQRRLHHIRSDIRLKHDIVLLGHLDDGLGFYRFSYNGSDTAYVGVMAQEVETVIPEAVMRGRDGYLRVSYETLGLHLQTYRHWIAAGARIPSGPAR
jgi:hypothetical protein